MQMPPQSTSPSAPSFWPSSHALATQTLEVAWHAALVQSPQRRTFFRARTDCRPRRRNRRRSPRHLSRRFGKRPARTCAEGCRWRPSSRRPRALPPIRARRARVAAAIDVGLGAVAIEFPHAEGPSLASDASGGSRRVRFVARVGLGPALVHGALVGAAVPSVGGFVARRCLDLAPFRVRFRLRFVDGRVGRVAARGRVVGAGVRLLRGDAADVGARASCGTDDDGEQGRGLA